MSIQIGQKGRLTAAAQKEEQCRRVNRPKKSNREGMAQFGGVGNIAQLDQGAAHLSSRARKALESPVYSLQKKAKTKGKKLKEKGK